LKSETEKGLRYPTSMNKCKQGSSCMGFTVFESVLKTFVFCIHCESQALCTQVYGALQSLRMTLVNEGGGNLPGGGSLLPYHIMS
jgi:hypothetical protein